MANLKGFKSKAINLTHKVCGTTAGDGDIQPKEVLGYSFSGFGQNLICTLVGTYLMIFFTDALLISPLIVAFIMLGARLFDAFNDPIMGSLVDKTRTKWGKLRPYLLFTPIPIAIMTILCFSNFNLGPTGTIIYATISYVIWGVVYTIIDVPYWGLASALTPDTQKRTNLLTIARLFCTAGAGLVTIIIPAITGSVTASVAEQYAPQIEAATAAGNLELVAQLQQTVTNLQAPALSRCYFFIALATALLAAPMFITGFTATKERQISAEKAPTLRHNLGLLVKNKPLLLVMLAGVLGSLRMLFMTMGIYFCKYNLGNEAFFGIFSLLTFPGGLIASVMTPWLCKKFGKKKVFIWSHLVGGMVAMLMYFVGYGSTWQLVLLVIGYVLLGVPSGFANILTYAMIADSVDYLELKTGERGEGICFSVQTFISKIGMAMITFVAMLILGIRGYVANTVQSESTLNGIFLGMTLITGLSTIAFTIPLFFYKFTEKEQAKAIEIIKARKAEAKGENASDANVGDEKPND